MEPSSICTRVQKLVGTVRFQLQQLEDAGALPPPPPQAPFGAGSAFAEQEAEEEARASLTQNLNAVFQELALLDRAIAENGGNRRDYYRKKAASLASDALEVRTAVERYLKTTYSTRKERRDREALMGGGARAGGGDTVAVDAFLQERGHLTSSHTMMDELASAAENVMGSLKSQRGVLKGVHRKVLDVGMRLGVSSSVMKLIERRTTGDKVIVYGGMAVLLLLLWIVVAWRSR